MSEANVLWDTSIQFIFSDEITLKCVFLITSDGTFSTAHTPGSFQSCSWGVYPLAFHAAANRSSLTNVHWLHVNLCARHMKHSPVIQITFMQIFIVFSSAHRVDLWRTYQTVNIYDWKPIYRLYVSSIVFQDICVRYNVYLPVMVHRVLAASCHSPH